ncbi:MAG: FAD-dependent oxidoreductase [Chitinophagales bacterium]
MQEKIMNTNCCIAGGGPAGMMTGFLLARAGIDVIVLEKHADFFRDFRGDTIHPSTFQLIHELGLLDEFLKIPHSEILEIAGLFNNQFIKMADFSHLRVAKPAIGLMPQWDFLNFLLRQANRYPGFHAIMRTEVTDLIKENGKVTGIRTETPDGIVQINANLVIGADGRHSVVREKAGLKIITTGVPMDVLWFKLSKKQTDPKQVFGNFYFGKIMVMLERTDYWQCGYVIAKGGHDKIKERGLQSFHEEISTVVPFLKDRVNELKDWEQIRLLSVAIDHLEKWYCDGLLCIGDAAHAMSPVGGVGINLAVQDAVAAANILYQSLKENKPVETRMLKRVQKRRSLPTKFTQRLQIAMQNTVISPSLSGSKQKRPPFFMRMVNRWSILRRITGKLIGIGVRAEHIHTPDIKKL